MDKHLTWKICFFLAFILAKRISELQGLSFHVWHSRGWKPCTFSYFLVFVANTQNSSVHNPTMEEFTIPSLDNFVGGDRDKMLLCSPRILKKYLSQMDQYLPDVSNPVHLEETGVPKHHFILD